MRAPIISTSSSGHAAIFRHLTAHLLIFRSFLIISVLPVTGFAGSLSVAQAILLFSSHNQPPDQKEISFNVFEDITFRLLGFKTNNANLPKEMSPELKDKNLTSQPREPSHTLFLYRTHPGGGAIETYTLPVDLPALRSLRQRPDEYVRYLHSMDNLAFESKLGIYSEEGVQYLTGTYAMITDHLTRLRNHAQHCTLLSMRPLKELIDFCESLHPRSVQRLIFPSM